MRVLCTCCMAWVGWVSLKDEKNPGIDPDGASDTWDADRKGSLNVDVARR